MTDVKIKVTIDDKVFEFTREEAEDLHAALGTALGKDYHQPFYVPVSPNDDTPPWHIGPWC